MKKFFRSKWLWIIFLSFGMILLCSFLFWFYYSCVGCLSPSESALDETRKLLTAVAAKPVGPMPDDLPGYLRVEEDCWTLLQQNMRKNANQYKLDITSVFDSRNDPHPARDMTEVWLNIEFPDGQIVQMYSYQGGLNLCRMQ